MRVAARFLLWENHVANVCVCVCGYRACCRLWRPCVLQASASGEVDKERAAKAMADPEIQAILRDPVVQQTLQDCQADPTKLRKVRATRRLRGIVCVRARVCACVCVRDSWTQHVCRTSTSVTPVQPACHRQQALMDPSMGPKIMKLRKSFQDKVKA